MNHPADLFQFAAEQAAAPFLPAGYLLPHLTPDETWEVFDLDLPTSDPVGWLICVGKQYQPVAALMPSLLLPSTGFNLAIDWLLAFNRAEASLQLESIAHPVAEN